MKGHWWSCVLGLLFMPAEVILSTWTVSQEPLSISTMRVNSSLEITCSTSLSDPLGFYLRRRFHGDKDIVHLSFKNEQITKKIIAGEFSGRIDIAQDQQIREGKGFTLQLSLLGLKDTDLYYCGWVTFRSEGLKLEALDSNGTVIIVRERDPWEQCDYQIVDLILIALSVTAFAAILLFAIGALIVKCKPFKKDFRPARDVKPSRPNRPQHICPPPRDQHCPYLITSESTLDFRGIL